MAGPKRTKSVLSAPLCLGLGADLVYFATPHPFEELEKTAFLLPFVAVFGQGRCHAGCKGAKGDLAAEVASFSQSGFMLANRLLDEFASIEGKLQCSQREIQLAQHWPARETVFR